MWIFDGGLKVWGDIQVHLEEVFRWSRFTNVRKQSVLGHTLGIIFLVTWITEKVKSELPLDSELLLVSFLVHDVGEGEKKRDVPFTLKTHQDDVDEYKAFVKLFDNLEAEVFQMFHKAFLLQFCFKEVEGLPDEAYKIINSLEEHKRAEALIFEATEHLEYLMFAIENDNAGNSILANIAGKSIEVLDRICSDLPVLGQEVWTSVIKKRIVEMANL